MAFYVQEDGWLSSLVFSEVYKRGFGEGCMKGVLWYVKRTRAFGIFFLQAGTVAEFR